MRLPTLQGQAGSAVCYHPPAAHAAVVRPRPPHGRHPDDRTPRQIPIVVLAVVPYRLQQPAQRLHQGASMTSVPAQPPIRPIAYYWRDHTAQVTRALRPEDVTAVYADTAPNEPVVEHAIEMSGGGMHIRYDDPEIERIFPLADWIKSQQRFGGHVWRRTVIVVEDWTEVPASPSTPEEQ